MARRQQFSSFRCRGSHRCLHVSLVMIISIAAVIACCIIGYSNAGGNDPYSTLGIKRTATQREVHKAYRRLAKLYHPDRNPNDPSANDRFQNINAAYEILSDEQKRRHFDVYGVEPEAAHAQRHHHQASPFTSMHFSSGSGAESFFFGGGAFSDPFEFFAGGGGGFGGGGGGGGGGDPAASIPRASRHQLEKHLIPESDTRPVLLFVRSRLCLQCAVVARLWRQVHENLAPLGVAVSIVDAEERGVASLLRVTSTPAIIAIANRRIRHYSDWQSGISVNRLATFLIDSVIGSEASPFIVTDANLVEEFFAQFYDGRARCLVASSESEEPPLWYLLTAFRHRWQCKFGYVAMVGGKIAVSRGIIANYSLQSSGFGLLIFDERSHPKPVFTKRLGAGKPPMSAELLDAAVQSMAWLAMPRIYSQKIFLDLCYDERDGDAICLLLLHPTVATADPADDNKLLVSFRRRFIEAYPTQTTFSTGDRRYSVRLAYLAVSTQSGWLAGLRSAANLVASDRRLNVGNVLLIRVRNDAGDQLSFDFVSPKLSAGIDSTEYWQPVMELVDAFLTDSRHRLPFFVQVPELLDENRPALLPRIYSRLRDWFDRVRYWLAVSESGNFYVMLLTTVVVVLLSTLFSFIIAMVRSLIGSLFGGSSSSGGGKQAGSTASSSSSKVNTRHPQVDKSKQVLNVRLFCAETFPQLVTELPRGQLSIVLLTCRSRQSSLLQIFIQHVAAFTRYYRLVFAFMDLDMDENRRWYRALLAHATGREVGEMGDISPERCAGTVLAINGYREYYCLYHEKYESSSTIGRFAGFDDDDDDDDDEGNGNSSRLLRRLPVWLDALQDGTVKRFRISRWPKMAAISSSRSSSPQPPTSTSTCAAAATSAGVAAPPQPSPPMDEERNRGAADAFRPT